MSPDHAQAALQFMSRVQMNAQEIPAFQEVCQALQAEAQPSEVTPIKVNEDDPKQQFN